MTGLSTVRSHQTDLVLSLTRSLSAGLGTFLALRAIDESLWRDEAATALAIDRSLPDLAAMIGSTDGGFAGYLVLMHTWARFAGVSEVALRLPSLLATIVTLVAVSSIVHRLTNSTLASGLVCLLFTLHPVTFVGYGIEARPYALAAMFVSLAVASVAGRPTTTGRAAAWALFGALGVSMHVLAILAVAPTALFLVPAIRRSPRIVALGGLPLGVGVVEMLLASQSSSLQDWITTPSVEDLIQIIRTVVGQPSAIAWLAVGAVGVLTVRKGSFSDQESRRVAGFEALAVVFWAIVPFGALLALSLAGRPSLLLRYVYPSVPAAVIVLGIVISVVESSTRVAVQSRPLLTASIGLVILIAFSAVALSAPQIQTRPDDVRAVATWIEDTSDGSTPLVLYAPDWGEAGPNWYLSQWETNFVDLGATRRQRAQDRTVYRQPAPEELVRRRISVLDELLVVTYPDAPAWNGVGEVGLEVLPDIRSCFSVEERQQFGEAVVERMVRNC